MIAGESLILSARKELIEQDMYGKGMQTFKARGSGGARRATAIENRPAQVTSHDPGDPGDMASHGYSGYPYVPTSILNQGTAGDCRGSRFAITHVRGGDGGEFGANAELVS